MTDGPEPLPLDVLGPSGGYRSRTRTTVTDVTGRAVAELSLAPLPYVARAMSALRGADTPPADRRSAALAEAGELFRSATIGGLPPAEYEHLVSRVSGLGISTVRAATAKLARHCEQAPTHTRFARPTGVVDDWRDPAAARGSGLWARRGNVFAVHAAGNHPAVHAEWLQAVALGYRVAVRPSRREPFTAHRLVSALRAAGFGDDQVVLLPGDHTSADEMIRGADRSIVYGGDAVVTRYAARPTVLPRGPGRSKILFTADVDWREHVDLVADSVSRGGGTGCTNTTAVLVEGDPYALAEAVAERLSALPSLPPEAEEAVLPVQPAEAARRMERHLLDVAQGTKAVLGGEGVVDELGDGSAVLRPAVFVVPEPDAEQTRAELPFPCVWIAAWTPRAGLRPLMDTLALTAVTRDADLVDRLAEEPTIRNLHVGPHPTYWNHPGVPHDGYLAEFLMEPKGFLGGLPAPGG